MQREVVLLYRIGISMFLRSPAISGARDGPFRRSLLVDVVVRARSFADKILCRVGWGWRGRSGEPFQNGAYANKHSCEDPKRKDDDYYSSTTLAFYIKDNWYQVPGSFCRSFRQEFRL